MKDVPPPEDPPPPTTPTTPEIETDPRIPPPPPPPGNNNKRNWIIGGSIAGGVLIVILLIILLTGSSSKNNSSSVASSPTANQSSTLPSFYYISPSAKPSASTNAPAPPSNSPPPVVFVPGTSSDPISVARFLFPDAGQACGAGGHYSSCPLTPGAIAGISHYLASFACCAPEALCRCPTNYETPSYTNNPADLPVGYDPSQGYTAVDVRLQFPGGGATPYEHMIVLLQKQADGTWIAFNTWCTSKSNLITASGATVCTLTSS